MLRTITNYPFLLFIYLKYLWSRFKIATGLAKEEYGIVNPFKYKGLRWVPAVHSMERLIACGKYDNFRPDDVVVATFAKSGTHFTFNTIISIYKAKGLIPKNATDEDCTAPMEIIRPAFMGKSSKDKSEGPIRGIEGPESPRIIVTHLPLSFLPPKIKEGKVKVVQCVRNPKDLLCSMFPFAKTMGLLSHAVKLHDFALWFMEGNVPGGSYFHYLKDWYPYRNNSNLLKLQFEDMKKDLRGNVIRVAEFLNLELTDQQINSIVAANTFENKKKEMGSNHPMYRKGKSGGWRSEITVEQNAMLDEWIQQEMKELPELKLQYE